MVSEGNGLIGSPVSRPNAKRLVVGRGCYTDDVRLPRMLHAAFLRSPAPSRANRFYRYSRGQRVGRGLTCDDWTRVG